jgi:hypothetical protein
MRFSARAVAAVAMLVGFYVLVVGLAVGLVVVEALLLVNRIAAEVGTRPPDEVGSSRWSTRWCPRRRGCSACGW